MKPNTSRAGFSLVELLTVIAIIAILAAIIFPVMNSVKQNAKKTQCITNLHSIQSALKMYKLDNRVYPTHLGPVGDNVPEASLAMENNRNQPDCLYPEYIKTPQAFKCPNVPTQSTTQTMEISDPTIGSFASYVYNSYDAQKEGGPEFGLRYTLTWAPTRQDVDRYRIGTAARSSSEEQAIGDEDYTRQLKWKNPPEDTVVTWCSYHLRSGPNTLVLFLDGHVDQIPGGKMDGENTSGNPGCRWRCRAKT